MGAERMNEIREGLRMADIKRDAGWEQEFLDDIVDLVREEFEQATSKHDSFASTHEGAAVLREEYEELWDDVKANRPADARAEAVQVAAMAVRFIFDVGDDWSFS